MRRGFIIAASGLAVCLALLLGALAAEPKHHKGTVISASAARIVVKDEGGKDQTFQVESTAKITIHGKPARLEDFEETMPVQVTTDEKGKVLAVATIDMHKRALVVNE